VCRRSPTRSSPLRARCLSRRRSAGALASARAPSSSGTTTAAPSSSAGRGATPPRTSIGCSSPSASRSGRRSSSSRRASGATRGFLRLPGPRDRSQGGSLARRHVRPAARKARRRAEDLAVGTGGPGTAVRVALSRQRADEWAVVLAAADIPHWLRRRLDGWALIVPAPDAAAALESLDAYDRENAREGADRGDAVAPSRPVTMVGVYRALLLIGLFAISGSRAGRSEWFQHGEADATRTMAGEWLRAVTALTLRAAAPQLPGHAPAGALPL